MMQLVVQSKRWLCACFLFVMLLFSTCAMAGNDRIPTAMAGQVVYVRQGMTPADVLGRVRLLAKEVDLIRVALGKPKHHQSLLKISQASPREVYFEAQALYKKANRLAFEVSGNYRDNPEIHADQLTPSHVWQLVNEALGRIQLVNEALHIQQKVREDKAPPSTTPTDVFNALFDVNQSLNALLYKRVAPSDVYEQITLAVNYSAFLLGALGISPRVPAAPKFVPNQRPSDVYQRLIQCIQSLSVIAQRSGVKMLKVHVGSMGVHHVSPSNVYDLSKIIVAEVRYFSTKLGMHGEPAAFYPGYKTPSDVYQRAGILLSQLAKLKAGVLKNQAWLNKGKKRGMG